MSQSPFNASSWLRQEAKPFSKQGPAHHSLTEKESTFAINQKFRPQDYFISGWRGDGLVSKNSLITLQALKLLSDDVRLQFKSQGLFNKSLKLDIYNEFLAFAEALALHCPELDHYQVFWAHLEMRPGPYRRELDHFLSIYFLRVAAIYIFKLRFLTLLCRECDLTVETKDLFNPNSFFAQVFRPGSSQEIKSEALETNHFSWYRPSSNLIDTLKKLSQALPQISSSEMLKGIFQKIESHYLPESESQQKYSHSLSHTCTGLFINLLLLKLPKWVQEKSFDKERAFSSVPKMPRPIFCKFTGDHLPSLSLSHWLAQEKSSNQKWDQIIYPEFRGQQFACGPFMKVCFDLQYLSLLCQSAKKQGHSPVSYIGHIMREKNRQAWSGQEQISMFKEVERTVRPYFDRIVLNLVDFPKSNPQFFLINQISAQYNELNEGGLLFVLSSKKLFVPSQSDKIDQLLQKFKLEFVFGLDGIKNRGELAPYVYVFSKSDPKLNSSSPFFSSGNSSANYSSGANKRPCHSFRINGDLTSFQKFSAIVEEMEHFLKHKRVDSTPLYQSEFGDGFTLEFYQDAVVDGKLINSTKNPSNVTHPNFFKNLMKSCIPLDHFFQIEALSPEHEQDGPLGLTIKRHDRFPYLLIVDFREQHLVKLEITSIASYEAKTQEYGLALCFYFGLTPKRPDININLFREFFGSRLGRQMIQLSLLGKMSKLKSRLCEILIPKFFTDAQQLPQHVQAALGHFCLNEDALLSLHPAELKSRFDQSVPTLSWLSQKYPWAVMGLLSFFKTSLQNSQSKLLAIREKEGINYNSAIVREVLIKTPTRPLFPENSEIYIEFKMKVPQEIHLPLSGIVLASKERHGQIGHYLELRSGEKLLVEIYSEMVALNFIRFILENSLNYPTSQLLQALQVPSIDSLKSIFAKIEDGQETFATLERKTIEIIEGLINGQISQNSQSE